MTVEPGTLLRDYRGKRFRVWAAARDPLDGTATVVLVADEMLAVHRDRPRAGVEVLTVAAARLDEAVLVDCEPPVVRRRVAAFVRVPEGA